jgi:hypothetical protein
MSTFMRLAFLVTYHNRSRKFLTAWAKFSQGVKVGDGILLDE